MGWSCRAEAGKVMEAWAEACVAQTGSANAFLSSRNKLYVWEASRTEHEDGAITGKILRVVRQEGDRLWMKPSGSFRIEGDGTIARAPKFLREVAP